MVHPPFFICGIRGIVASDVREKPMEERMTVGIDTGGTFTDLVFQSGEQWGIYKLLSTPSNPALAVLRGLEAVAGERPKSIVHGSTVATNALLERKGAKTALVTNRGMEDILEIGRQNRPRLYALTWKPPQPLVPRDLRMGIKGRVLPGGRVLEEIDPRELERMADHLVEKGVESVAVSLLFSFAHPSHERKVGEAIKRRGLPVSLSHEILSEFREYERTSTTVINAYVLPIMERYLSHIQGSLGEGDTLRIMQSNGGVISAARAGQEPVRTILSGPAGGAVGGLEVARAAGYSKVITFDMGGTSTDVSLMDGKLAMTTEAQVAGFPVKVPMIEIHTVGAGGGSIARIDRGGSLRVGPQSAGADPGPICYGKGKEITVTDAHLFLGRLVPQHFLGGRMKLHRERLDGPFREMAGELGISPLELAEGILSVANATMERAIRVISVERGYNPADFTLVSFGGAGGLHAAFLARALNIPRVLVPRDPGTLSALGMLLADIIKDYSITLMLEASRDWLDRVEKALEPLKEQALRDLRGEGLMDEEIHLEPALDMRYKGQSFEITVPFTGENTLSGFHQAHEKLYGYCNRERPVEIVNLRLRGRGVPPKPRLVPIKEGKPSVPGQARVATAEAVFQGRSTEVEVYQREKLLANNILPGPCLVVEYSATLVIPPFARGRVDHLGNIILEMET